MDLAPLPCDAPACLGPCPSQGRCSAAAAGQALPGDLDLQDWGDLMDAVKQRLRLCISLSANGQPPVALTLLSNSAGQPPGTELTADGEWPLSPGPPSLGPGLVGAQRRAVLECIDALDQLQATIQHLIHR